MSSRALRVNGRWLALLERISIVCPALAGFFALAAILNPAIAHAQSVCPGSSGLGSERQLDLHVNSYRGRGDICTHRTDGFDTILDGRVTRASATDASRLPTSLPRLNADSGRASPLDLIRLYCRRDDYAFLPAGARGGLPCTTITSGAVVDPGQVANELLASLDLPSVKLGMNPRLGMVAVPTWFWVEGYGGEVIPLSKTLTVPHERCELVVQRDLRGDPVLGSDGSPAVDRRCTTTFQTIGVEVRAWPSTYHWDFGDSKDQTLLCRGVGACAAGLGRAYTDPHTPSPIQHAYRFSSLGKQGEVDAYGVQFAITFSAQYRFSFNGNFLGGWQSLPDRELGWSANHKVQEAQAVLTRP